MSGAGDRVAGPDHAIEVVADGDLAGCLVVRREVFVIEQRIPEEEETDAYDAYAVHLLASDPEGRPVGTVSWHGVMYGPNPESRGWNIGISLVPEARGQGFGGAVQRQLAERLFATTAANRVEATTDVENVAEQRALEKAGFSREGVQRGAQWRGGAWHDVVTYSITRSDLNG